jgi:hypothetical protein
VTHVGESQIHKDKEIIYVKRVWISAALVLLAAAGLSAHQNENAVACPADVDFE